eukprot:6021180-Prymnesium_polylepis.2
MTSAKSHARPPHRSPRTPQQPQAHRSARRALPPEVRAILTFKDPFPDGDALLNSSALRDRNHPDHQKTVDLLAKARRKRAADWRCRCREAARRALREHMYARSHGSLCAVEIETSRATGSLEDELLDRKPSLLPKVAR